MLFKSGLITQGSGSVGGLTLSRGRSGMYFRGRAMPVNPGTAYQASVRAAMAQLAVGWNDLLTADQRAAWAAYAAQVSMTNKLGDPVFLTGMNHYIRSNVARLQVGLDRVDDAPIIYNVGQFTEPTLSIVTADDDVSVAFDNTDEWANEADSALLVFGSVPKSLTIGYFKGPYQYLGAVAGDAVTPPTSPAAFDLHAPIAVGQKAFFRTVVTRADGRYSYPIYDEAEAF